MMSVKTGEGMGALRAQAMQWGAYGKTAQKAPRMLQMVTGQRGCKV